MNDKQNKQEVTNGRQKISFANIRWNTMTDAEIADKVFNDPANAGAIRTKSPKNFKITVYLTRQRLKAQGQDVDFKGRKVVCKDGSEVVKTKWVRASK